MALAVVAAAAVTLRMMGRLPFCKCGIVSLWSGDIWSNQNSQQVFDPYSFTHVLHGTLIYLLLWLLARRLPIPARMILAVTLESAWEILENTNFVIDRYRAVTMSRDYYGDSILNSVGDIVTMAAGFVIASRIPPRVTVAGSILIDALLLFWIRDSLAINIVMLIYPLDVIRRWQAGSME